MSGTLLEFNQLTDAEQYFEFFALPYDAALVNVNRLHILQKFSGMMKTINAEVEGTAITDVELLDRYEAALIEAYEVFMSSNAVEQKLFKVFKDKPKNVVMLGDIKV
ncbi:MAG: nitrogenase-stabilizing/protective protein NifW [Oculatellaceae cyanobacterium Prado106]|jgi:nitrogenase-stabilizing/protective protein|nr:nitrogenase-stabilizing/protective protein NifW [Oculatellaceae cyanobacterium Prado106]